MRLNIAIDRPIGYRTRAIHDKKKNIQECTVVEHLRRGDKLVGFVVEFADKSRKEFNEADLN